MNNAYLDRRASSWTLKLIFHWLSETTNKEVKNILIDEIESIHRVKDSDWGLNPIRYLDQNFYF